MAIAMALAASALATDAIADDAVTLRFDRPQDLAGRVAFTMSNASQSGTAAPTETETHGHARFSMTGAVGPAGDLIMAFEDSDYEIVRNTATGEEGRLAGFFAPIAMSPPDYRVGRDGGYLRLDRPDAFLQSIASAVDPVIADIAPEYLDALRPTIEIALSREEHESLARNRWRDEVGRWIDRTVETGKPAVEDEMIELPYTGGGQVPARQSYRLIGRVPCGDGGRPVCVDLELRTVADGPSAIAGYAAILRRLDSSTQVRAFQLQSVTRLVSDPRTLVLFQRRTEWSSLIELDSYPEAIVIQQSGAYTATYDYD